MTAEIIIMCLVAAILVVLALAGGGRPFGP